MTRSDGDRRDVKDREGLSQGVHVPITSTAQLPVYGPPARQEAPAQSSYNELITIQISGLEL